MLDKLANILTEYKWPLILQSHKHNTIYYNIWQFVHFQLSSTYKTITYFISPNWWAVNIVLSCTMKINNNIFSLNKLNSERYLQSTHTTWMLENLDLPRLRRSYNTAIFFTLCKIYLNFFKAFASYFLSDIMQILMFYLKASEIPTYKHTNSASL